MSASTDAVIREAQVRKCVEVGYAGDGLRVLPAEAGLVAEQQEEVRPGLDEIGNAVAIDIHEARVAFGEREGWADWRNTTGCGSKPPRPSFSNTS